MSFSAAAAAVLHVLDLDGGVAVAAAAAALAAPAAVAVAFAVHELGEEVVRAVGHAAAVAHAVAEIRTDGG